MKKLLAAAFIPSIVALLFAVDAGAQQTGTDPKSSTEKSADKSADKAATKSADKADKAAEKAKSATRETFAKPDDVRESKEVIGTRIKNAQGKDIGEIDRLLIDPKDGKITHVVVGVGGLAGVGEKHLVVPWSELKFSADGKKMVVTLDQAALESAPRFVSRPASAERRPASPSASPSSSPRRQSGDEKK